MEGLRLRGAAFRRRREERGLTETEVATMLRVPRKNVVAFEEGVIMQTPTDAETKIASLNTKWTTEEMMNYRTRRTA